MFTDLVGFTALTQADEARALALLERHQRLLRPIFPRFHGREVKTIGDSFLVEFESALDATNCAVEIQRSLAAANRDLAEGEQVHLRIGIHLGDVVRSDGDVLGDAVNIASRIEPLAEPDGVCVSEQVFDQVANKLPVPLERLERADLKNVRSPIAVYRLVLERTRGEEAPPSNGGSGLRRLAVLPLANLSPDPQDEFFADGLTDELITELSQIPGLRVIARTSVVRYKNTEKAIREIGRELRVQEVLEGGVRKAGNRIRITAQLIDAATEEHLWAQRFDRELTDIFAVQSDIATSVAKALELTPRTPGAVRRGASPRPEAHTLYLRGRFLWNKRSTPHVREALQQFQAATLADPTYASAYAGVADCYSILNDRGALSPAVAIPAAFESAKKALALDSDLAEAHASLGLVYENSFLYEDAVRELRRAIELRPSYAVAHLWLYLALSSLDRRDEASAVIAHAEEADPLSPALLNSVGFDAFIRGDFDRALALWDRVAELEPNFEPSRLNRIGVHVLRGQRAEAVRLFEALDAVADPGADSIARQGLLTAMAAMIGLRERVLRGLDVLRATEKVTYVPHAWIGIAYAYLGDLDKAFEEFYQGYATGSSLSSIRGSPLLEPLRKDPRFEPLVRHWATVHSQWVRGASTGPASAPAA